MQKLNAGKFSAESSMNLTEFTERVYLPYIEEKRASTKKDTRKSGGITFAIASDTFNCVNLERWMPAGCSRQSPTKMI
jgi:hypothetical protein